ncbi:hypothetical protein [Streptomyces subrutilus]|uniref:hypothetical protein n=1 Tax=Streptomyces subrutilus TaxID=36818 RepID=UPI0014319A2F|nr:hypothetical protein [Streptomyces subrutilus]
MRGSPYGGGGIPTGETLVLLDTGVTAAFRAALREPADRVRPALDGAAPDI